MTQFSVCVLFYGDHPELASRVLESLRARLPDGGPWLQDLRLGLNACHPRVAAMVHGWADVMATHHQLPVIVWETVDNVLKYPMMRRMLREDYQTPAEWVMWFDDDSFLVGPLRGWWEQVGRFAQDYDMVGQRWWLPMQGSQWDWIQEQPWYNPQVGPPPLRRGRPHFTFCQGAWWVLRREILDRYDWPPRELRHCGGDSMLGELCRHQGLRLGWFDEGVRINADGQGRHSGAPRRGISEPVLGKHHRSGVRPQVNHDFPYTRVRYPCLLQDSASTSCASTPPPTSPRPGS